MSLTESELLEIRLLFALLTHNRQQLKELLPQCAHSADAQLYTAVRKSVDTRTTSRASKLVALSGRLPAWVQFLGQRAVLLSPRIAQALLIRTGLHHQKF